VFVAVFVTALSANPIVEASAGSSAAPAQVASRIESLRKSLAKIVADLNEADRVLAGAELAARKHQRALQTASQRQLVLREALAGRAAAMYTMGSGSVLNTILGAQDFEEFMDKYSYLELIRGRESALLEELSALRRRAHIESAELARAIKLASKSRARYVSRYAELTAKMRDLKSLQDLYSALGGGSARLSRAPNGFVCPVAGYHYLTNNYGDPRPGGPHTGEDISAHYGTAEVAVLPARVVSTPNGGWIGVGLILRDAMGNEWWYAHMASRTVGVGDRVKAGQLVGRVGCSGRCYGAHLHFEYHPHGGGPANPHRILSSAC
jgi:murein DD-endopeptidase MepM/ murein hydrolase activator NlpD